MIGFEILQKSVDFIENHLLDNITYVDVANQVNMSPYEFHRTFRFISSEGSFMTQPVVVFSIRITLHQLLSFFR